jgi:hypothetical protein
MDLWRTCPTGTIIWNTLGGIRHDGVYGLLIDVLHLERCGVAKSSEARATREYREGYNPTIFRCGRGKRGYVEVVVDTRIAQCL